MTTTQTAPACSPLVLDVHICRERRSYTATFAPGTDAVAAAFVAARMATHAMTFMEEINFERTGVADPNFHLEDWPQVVALLLPTCHHGMDGRNCMDPDGPHHFGTLAQDLANGDSW